VDRVGRNNPCFFAALAFDHLECSPGQRVQHARHKPRLLAAFLAAVGYRLLCANHSLHDDDMECRQDRKHNLIFELSPAIISRNQSSRNVEMWAAMIGCFTVHLAK
jgi:hypothetical protein